MKLGLLTAAFPDTPLTEVAEWAAGNGFSMLEVACWPRADGPSRRYAGVSHIDCAALGDDEAKQLVGELSERSIEISGLGYYPNPLSPDLGHRADVVAHLRTVIEAAAKLGVPVVNTFIGNDKDRSLTENFAEFLKVWPDIVHHAADHGVKIGIENCPMIFSADEWPGGNNLMYAPAIWRDVFDAIDRTDHALGLNLDPSHLVWQMIDYERVVASSASRIYHVHAKDMEIDRDGLYDRGVMSAGVGWQVPRLPGLGEIRWDRFIAALYRAGYDYAVVVEHEDRGFEGSDEKVKAGFCIARDAVGPVDRLMQTSAELITPLPEDVPATIRAVKRRLRGQLGDPRAALEVATEALRDEVAAVATEIADVGTAVPLVEYSDIAAGTVPAERIAAIRRRGCAVVRGTFDRDEAEAWDDELATYLDGNDFMGRYRGPADELFSALASGRPQIYGVYWSRPQIAARQHEHMVNVRRFLNSFWKHESGGRQWFDPDHDIGYPDRIRRRQPSTPSLGLSPHADSGSIERWLLPAYQASTATCSPGSGTTTTRGTAPIAARSTSSRRP